jgi:DNA-binding transcriptional LysR family regulator
VDAEALKTFLAVARHRSFSDAARLLGRTQPAISRRIRMLEQELGAPLFERDSSPIVLSQAGRVLLPFADRALAALEDAKKAVRSLRDANAGPLSLAIVGTLAGRDFSHVLRRYAINHPDVEISLRTARSAEVSDLVRRGEAVIGVRYDRDRSPDLELQFLGSEPLVIACATDHRLCGRAIKSLAILRDEPWIAFPEIAGQREISASSHVFGLFQAHGLGDVDWTPVDSLTAQKRLVEAGLGVALMPESSIAEEFAAGSVGTIRVPGIRSGAPVFAVTRKGGFLSAAAQRFLDLLRTEYSAVLTGGSEKVHKR